MTMEALVRRIRNWCKNPDDVEPITFICEEVLPACERILAQQQAAVDAGGQEAQVVYERQDAYDMQSGPHGFERIGFRIGDRVFWVGCAGSGMPSDGVFERDHKLAETLVQRWNAFISV